MRDNTYKTFLLTVLVIVLLFALHFLPSFSVFGMKLRKINILSQIITFPGDNETIDVIPKPKDPKQIQARSKSGKLLNFKEIWPKGVQPVLDYSEGNGGGMDHFMPWPIWRQGTSLKDGRYVWPTMATASSKATFLSLTSVRCCSRNTAETEWDGLMR